MRCARCNRPLFDPAAAVGRHGMGAVCARKAGLLPPPKARVLTPHRVYGRRRALSEQQLELFQ